MSRKAKTTMETEASASYKFPLTWKEEPNTKLIYGDCEIKHSDKILAFDMDGTLINVKSGAKFAKNKDDWVIWHEKVVPTIKSYYDKGYKIAIMTNQKGIEKGHTDVNDLKHKIQNIVEHIGVPTQVFISSGDDYYRKPSPGMWKFLGKSLNGGIEINNKESIYCGDAAGRPKEKTRKADHEDTDYKFALNCGAQFKTPEMLFLGLNETLPKFEFDPRTIKTTGSLLRGKDDSHIKSKDKELVIFVGSPGSGKSTLWRNHLSDYVRVNNDTLKSKPKCLKVCEDGLKAGKSVCIDNTNPSKAVRKEYIDLAKKYGYPVRCFFFDVPKHVAMHMNDLRTYNIHRDHESDNVPKVIIHTFYKNFEAPTIDEGYKSVETVELIAGPFKNKDDEELFFSYISSKK
jgi:bifunctional polynucleotide phosphatase/kinase